MVSTSSLRSLSREPLVGSIPESNIDVWVNTLKQKLENLTRITKFYTRGGFGINTQRIFLKEHYNICVYCTLIEINTHTAYLL